MPAFNSFHTLPVRASRAACGLAGIFLLLLQMLGPVLASPGESMWVEICSEAGAVWVQVDLEEEGDNDPTAPCPKCADCALCAVAVSAPMPGALLPASVGNVQNVRFEHGGQCILYSPKHLWPETRGPPFTTLEESERAPRASMASTQLIGGAPWS